MSRQTDLEKRRTVTQLKEKFEIRKLPMMPIRDVVIFPYMMTPFIVGRESSVRALEETAGYQPVEKSCFSAQGCGEFVAAMRMLKKKQIVVAGVETHVCVYQTVTDLLAAGYDVTIVADAMSSRAAENRDIAIRRMVAEGAHLSSTEMVLFELTVNSGTDEFRSISKLVK